MALRELVFDVVYKSKGLNNLTKTSSAVDKLKESSSKTGKSLDNMASKAGKAGGTLTTKLTAPIGAAGGAMVVLSENMEQAMNNIQSQTGASGAELEAYETTLKNVASSGSGSFEEVGNAIMQVSQNMRDLPTAELENVTEKALGLAETFGDDVGTVTRSAQTLMQNFGVTSAEAFDMITAGYQEGLNFSGEYLDTLNEYGPQFQALGFSGEEMFNTLISGAESGAWNLDKVGDAVKEFNIRAKDGSDTTNQAFSSLGFNADMMGQKFAQGGTVAQQAFGEVVTSLQGVENQQERNRLGVALFGTQYEDLEGDVVSALGGATGAMGDYDGKAQEVANNSRSSWDRMKGSLNEIAGTLNDTLAPAMDTVANVVQSVADKFSNLSPGTQQAVVGIVAVVGAIGPLLLIFSKVVFFVLRLKKAFALAKGAMLLLTGPVGIVIGVIAGLIAIGVAIYKNWDTIKEKASQLGLFLSLVWTNIKMVFMTVWNSIAQFFITIWTTLKGWVVAYFTTLITFYTTVFTTIKTVISTVLTGIWTFITNIWTTIRTTVVNLVTSLKTGIVSRFVAIKTAVVNKAIEIKTSVVNKIIEMVTGFVSKITGLKTKVTTKMVEVKDAIVNKVKDIPTEMLSIGKDIVQGIINGIGDKIGALKDKATEIADSIKNNVKGLLGINSPSRVFMDYGGWIGDGLTIGMDNTSKDILSSSKSLALNTVGGYESGVSKYTPNSPSTNPNNGNVKMSTTVHVTVQGGNSREIANNMEAEMERVINKVNKKMALQVSTI